ncbi:phospholipase [Streptomyces liangshanensis]|uniref:Phospholipase n=2 Tax=Streptomyces liangshanensis TaxID=2717324 RepID=A0A6G9H7T3_9ACTN|nr:phospholipase [Streptomyces liangshanensis]
MHGWSYDEAHLFRLTRSLHGELVVASVRGPFAEAGGYAWFPSRGNPIGNPRPSLANAMADAVLTWLDAQPSFSSVGLIGFSQGGAMALQMVRRDPSRFSYAVQLGGFVVGDSLPGDAELARTRPPVFWGRGGLDGVIPQDAVARTDAWTRRHAAADIRVYPELGHDVAGREVDDLTEFVRRRIA